LCDGLRKVLPLIAEDNGGNALVEEKWGKAFHGTGPSVQEKPEEDYKEEK
jgi:hypothetical protein